MELGEDAVEGESLGDALLAALEKRMAQPAPAPAAATATATVTVTATATVDGDGAVIVAAAATEVTAAAPMQVDGEAGAAEGAAAAAPTQPRYSKELLQVRHARYDAAPTQGSSATQSLAPAR